MLRSVPKTNFQHITPHYFIGCRHYAMNRDSNKSRDSRDSRDLSDPSTKRPESIKRLVQVKRVSHTTTLGKQRSIYALVFNIIII